jgi:hypothetical protein
MHHASVVVAGVFASIVGVGFVAGAAVRGAQIVDGSAAHIELWTIGGAVTLAAGGVAAAVAVELVLSVLTLGLVAIRIGAAKLRSRPVFGGPGAGRAAWITATTLSVGFLVGISPIVALVGLAWLVDFHRF